MNPWITVQEFNLYFNPEWESVLLGEESVGEAMQTVARQVDQAIQDNRALAGRPTGGPAG